MRTTLDLPEPLVRKVRALARERNVPLRAIIAEALGRFLDEPTSASKFRLPDRSFHGDGLVAEVKWEQIGQRVDEERR